MKKPLPGIIDVLASPWAIIPEKLQEISAIYKAHIRGEKTDISEIEATIGRTLNNEQKAYEIINGVAVLPVNGIIAKKMNLFIRISGGVSTQIFQKNLKMAEEDKEAHSIILLEDSPGGTVDGTQLAAHAVRDTRKTKRVFTVADGLMASGAYWIGSSAERIFIVDDTTEVGSIGVVATHEDWSKYEEKLGIKTTEITAGKYKRIASEHAPLSQEGRQYIQEIVDQIYTLFVNEVAVNRNTDAETVLNNMADGRIFMGSKAVEAGLVDGIKSLNEVIDILNEENASKTKMLNNKPINRAVMPQNKKESIMDVKELKEKYPDLVASIEKDATAGHAEAIKAAKAEGAKEERERIQAVHAQSFPGFENIITEAMFDGKSQAGDVAMKINAENFKKTQKAAQENHEDAIDAIEEPQNNDVSTGGDEEEPVTEGKLKAKWDKDAKLRAEFANDYEACKAYFLDSEGVKVKVLKNK